MSQENFIDRLQSHANDAPEKLAIKGDSIELTYAALHEQTLGAMSYLSQRGVSSGSTVGITLPNEADHLVATLALLGLGARQIVLPTHDSMAQRAELAQRVGMQMQLVSSADEGVVSDLIPFPPPESLRSMRLSGDQTESGMSGQRGQGVLYLKTSGTTSRTNIVEFSESDIGRQAARHPDYGNESLLRLASVEYNNSKRHRLYSIWNGGTNVIKPTRPFDVASYVLEKDVTCLDISRLHAIDLLKNPKASQLAAVKIRTGGSGVPYALRAEIERRVTKNLYVRYAATECGAISMAYPGEHNPDERSGRALTGIELQVVDADDQELPPGSVGLLRLKADGMARAYFDNPQQTSRRFRNGWFYPGDLASIGEDRAITVHGRADEMIIMNGLNIYPAEIERVLESAPRVRAAAAFPIESRIHGQIPVAAVEIDVDADGHVGERDTEGLLAYCRQALGIRAPRKIIVLTSLPRSSQGKVLKSQLADIYASKKNA